MPYDSNEQHDAATGIQFQRKINDLRPVDVYRRVTRITDKLNFLRDKVVGADGVKALEEIQKLFFSFYTGQKDNVEW